MKISYLFNEIGYTGGTTVIYNLLNRAVEDGHEVYLITADESVKWKKGIEKYLIKEYIKNNKFKEIMKKKLKDSKILSTYRDYKNHNYDKYILKTNKKIEKNWIKSDYTIASFCTTAYACNDLSDYTIPVYHMQHYEELFMTGNKMAQKIARNTYSLPINLISNSKWLQTEINNRFNRMSYLLTPAVDDNIFYCRNNVKNKYKDMKKIKILAYADSRNFKGFNDGTKVFKIIKEKYGDKVEITYFGGYEPQKLDYDYNYVGRVFGDDLGRLYSENHIVFLSSWYESFPLQPLEAMKSGTLVVSTAFGTEDYLNDKNSILLYPRKINEMVDKLSNIIEGNIDMIEMVENGIQKSKEYTWENTYNNFMSILKDIKNNDIRKKFSDIDLLVNGDFSLYRK